MNNTSKPLVICVNIQPHPRYITSQIFDDLENDDAALLSRLVNLANSTDPLPTIIDNVIRIVKPYVRTSNDDCLYGILISFVVQTRNEIELVSNSLDIKILGKPIELVGIIQDEIQFKIPLE